MFKFLWTTARKIIFSFSRCPKKMVFPTKMHWNMIFLALSVREYFFFPKIWSYTLDGRWKMIFPKKIRGNMIFYSNFLKRWSFQKGPRRHMVFLVLSGKMVFFSRKHDIFSLGRKWEAAFLRKCMEIWHFLCTHTGVTNVAPRPSVKINQGWSYAAKTHLKVIDVLDWHPRKSSSNSLYFHRDLYRRFHALLSSEEKQEN